VDDTYGGALLAAIEAAREAGSLLRQDFLKPGGPSGHDDHAEADWLPGHARGVSPGRGRQPRRPAGREHGLHQVHRGAAAP
jgi:hypothetical protein